MSLGNDKIKVLIVDDSSSSRVMLKRLLETDPGIDVLAAVQDAYTAARTMKDVLPDVILLDLEMPGMDGLTFLRKIMEQRPLPIIICSSLTDQGSNRTVEALEAGAIDVILKPTPKSDQERAEAAEKICNAVYGAAQSRGRGRTVRRRAAAATPVPPSPKLTADEILPPPNFKKIHPRTEPIICIGASTGGTEALREVLCALPPDAPGIVVVQHMPKGFTAAFAKRLDSLAQIRVFEAADGMPVQQGHAIIAAGDKHLALQRIGQNYRCKVIDGSPVSRHKPSADVLFRSGAAEAGANTLGIIMTGMGDDGAVCLGEIKQIGGRTIAQDEASCVVYGMPRAAVERGHAQQVMPLNRIATAIMAFARMHRGG